MGPSACSMTNNFFYWCRFFERHIRKSLHYFALGGGGDQDDFSSEYVSGIFYESAIGFADDFYHGENSANRRRGKGGKREREGRRRRRGSLGDLTWSRSPTNLSVAGFRASAATGSKTRVAFRRPGAFEKASGRKAPSGKAIRTTRSRLCLRKHWRIALLAAESFRLGARSPSLTKVTFQIPDIILCISINRCTRCILCGDQAPMVRLSAICVP